MTFSLLDDIRPHEFATNLENAWDLLVNGMPIPAIAEQKGVPIECITVRLTSVAFALLRSVRLVEEAGIGAEPRLD
jgi:hypothetical protein